MQREAYVATGRSLSLTDGIHDHQCAFGNSAMRPVFVLAIALVTVTAFFGTFSWADEKPSDDEFIFKTRDLSNQDTRPFRFGGKIMSESSGRWEQYRHEIFQYPNAIPCLSSSADEFDKVDLRDFDWTQHNRVAGLDVCIFRILDTLQSVDLMEKWIAFQGFSVSPNRRFVNDSDYVREGTVYATHFIEGYVPYGVSNSKASKALSEKSNLFKPIAFSLNVYLDGNGNIAGVRVTPRTK